MVHVADVDGGGGGFQATWEPPAYAPENTLWSSFSYNQLPSCDVKLPERGCMELNNAVAHAY